METNRLEQAIHSAVAATTAPDDARLADILARLEQAPIVRQGPRRTVWPWLLLAAAGAAAAGGGYLYVQHARERAPAIDTPVITAPTETPLPAAVPPVSPPAASEPHDGDDRAQRNTAIIYRQ
jgi:hypothetical protein